MTIRAPSTPPAAAPLAAPAAGEAPAAHPSSGVVVGGTPSGDVIVMSRRALAILRAGQLVRAFVIAGLETIRRRVALGTGRTVLLEHGIYQLV